MHDFMPRRDASATLVFDDLDLALRQSTLSSVISVVSCIALKSFRQLFPFIFFNSLYIVLYTTNGQPKSAGCE